MTKKELKNLEKGKARKQALHTLKPHELLELIKIASEGKNSEDYTFNDILKATTLAFTLGYLRGENKGQI